jgi:hypothetical protein
MSVGAYITLEMEVDFASKKLHEFSNKIGAALGPRRIQLILSPSKT